MSAGRYKQMRAKYKGRCAEAKSVAIFPLPESSNSGRDLGITASNPICLHFPQKGGNVEFVGYLHYSALQADGCLSQLIPLGCFYRKCREGDALAGQDPKQAIGAGERDAEWSHSFLQGNEGTGTC